jgi:hypothetical protein
MRRDPVFQGKRELFIPDVRLFMRTYDTKGGWTLRTFVAPEVCYVDSVGIPFDTYLEQSYFVTSTLEVPEAIVRFGIEHDRRFCAQIDSIGDILEGAIREKSPRRGLQEFLNLVEDEAELRREEDEVAHIVQALIEKAGGLS